MTARSRVRRHTGHPCSRLLRRRSSSCTSRATVAEQRLAPGCRRRSEPCPGQRSYRCRVQGNMFRRIQREEAAPPLWEALENRRRRRRPLRAPARATPPHASRDWRRRSPGPSAHRWPKWSRSSRSARVPVDGMAAHARRRIRSCTAAHWPHWCTRGLAPVGVVAPVGELESHRVAFAPPPLRVPLKTGRPLASRVSSAMPQQRAVESFALPVRRSWERSTAC